MPRPPATSLGVGDMLLFGARQNRRTYEIMSDEWQQVPHSSARGLQVRRAKQAFQLDLDTEALAGGGGGSDGGGSAENDDDGAGASDSSEDGTTILPEAVVVDGRREWTALAQRIKEASGPRLRARDHASCGERAWG